MKSPLETFTDEAAGVMDLQAVSSLLLAITQQLYEEIEELKEQLMPKPIVGQVGTVTTDDRVPGSLDGVYKGAGK